MECGTSAQANFNFDTTDGDELPLQAGDIVQILEVIDDDWAVGTSNGRSGRFPISFVSPVNRGDNAGISYQAGQFVVAIETFLADTEGDLGFKKSDIIEIIAQVDENWLKGRINGKEGIFPLAYVTHREGTATNGIGLTCKVISSNVGQLSDELTVSEGDVITNLEKIDDDWFKGSCNGRTGMVPALCVKVIEDGTKSDNTSNLVNKQFSEAFNSQGKQDEDSIRSTSQPADVEPGIITDSSSVVDPPWATSLFPFSAESKKELSFMDNETIKLLYRIDADWLVGIIDGNVGMFPATFVEVVVDVPDGYDERPQSCKDLCKTDVDSKDSNSVDKNNILSLELPNQEKLGRILFDFDGETDQDVSVKKGDVITIIEQLDPEWYEAQTGRGDVGFIPVSYVKLLEKPKSPSLKRPAPPPPIKKRMTAGNKPLLPTKPLKAGDPAPNIPNGASELLDIFGPISDTSCNFNGNSAILNPVSKPKPALAPKPSPTHKPLDKVTNLLDLDPFPVVDATSIPSPEIVPSGSSPKPVSFPGNLPSTTQQQQPTVNPISSVGSSSLIDFSPSDKLQTSVLTPVIHNSSAISIEPQLPGKGMVKQGSVDSLSGILSAKPFGASSTKVRSVHRPVTKNSPEKQPGAIDSSLANVFNQKVNSAFDSVDPLLDSFATDTQSSFNPFNARDNEPAGTIIEQISDNSTFKTSDRQSSILNITPFSAAVEEIFAQGTKEKVPSIRQPSPNPFAPPTIEEMKSDKVASPFSAEDNLGFADDFELDSLNPQISTIPRDESINSELSSDDFNSLMPSFVIKPVDTIERSSDTQSAFILPPPPAKRISVNFDKPKPKKFNQNSAVPRPRPLSSGSRPQGLISSNQSSGYVPESSFQVLTSQALVADDLVGFEVSSNSLKDEVDKESGPPAYTPPELPTDLDGGLLIDESSLVVGDLLGLVSSDTVEENEVKPRRSAPSRPIKEPSKKSVPPRPGPPRPMSKPRYQSFKPGDEEILLLQRHEEVTVAVDATQTKEMVAALKASLAEFQTELDKQTKKKQQLEQEMSFLECETVDNSMAETYNEVVENITHLTDKVSSLKEQIEELEPDQEHAAKKKKVPTATLR